MNETVNKRLNLDFWESRNMKPEKKKKSVKSINQWSMIAESY